ncbi:MAG TPA: type II toxin-antitoxin system VapC family toxin [Candidatus Limnocylindria bacterium]|nr:type II toxin-antitoxin system VapC family toxin [Candidatus Limnocylindria bacterium]
MEVPAALWRKHRIGELSAEDTGLLSDTFEWEWAVGAHGSGTFHIVDLTDDVLETAVRSLSRHTLRGSDAVQLASAMLARAADPALTEFACFDVELRVAARGEGFALLPTSL